MVATMFPPSRSSSKLGLATRERSPRRSVAPAAVAQAPIASALGSSLKDLMSTDPIGWMARQPQVVGE